MQITFVMRTTKKHNFISIYSGTPWEAKCIKALLQSANLNAFVRDEMSAKKAADNPSVASKFTMNVVVLKEHYTSALKIISDYQKVNKTYP